MCGGRVRRIACPEPPGRRSVTPPLRWMVRPPPDNTASARSASTPHRAQSTIGGRSGDRSRSRRSTHAKGELIQRMEYPFGWRRCLGARDTGLPLAADLTGTHAFRLVTGGRAADRPAPEPTCAGGTRGRQGRYRACERLHDVARAGRSADPTCADGTSTTCTATVQDDSSTPCTANDRARCRAAATCPPRRVLSTHLRGVTRRGRGRATIFTMR